MALIVFRDIIALSSGSDATTDTEQLYKFSLLSITLAYIHDSVHCIEYYSEFREVIRFRWSMHGRSQEEVSGWVCGLDFSVSNEFAIYYFKIVLDFYSNNELISRSVSNRNPTLQCAYVRVDMNVYTLFTYSRAYRRPSIRPNCLLRLSLTLCPIQAEETP